MRRYKFTISFENSSYPGYVTEKIIDAFINCHDFPNFDSVVRHVIEVDGDDGQYRRYASVPPFAKRLRGRWIFWNTRLRTLRNRPPPPISSS